MIDVLGNTLNVLKCTSKYFEVLTCTSTSTCVLNKKDISTSTPMGCTYCT